jgi:hypothetical protein
MSQRQTNVVGFRPPDEEYHRMKASYDCHCRLDLDPPHQVDEFFGAMGMPDDAGTEVSMGDAVRDWEGFGMAGLEIEVDKLPSYVKIIRFINWWG